MYKIVAISDTHNQYNKLVIPECDILISAGDYSNRGSSTDVRNFHKWLNLQPAKHKISVQGNHEVWVENNFSEAKMIANEECPGVFFVHKDLIEIDGIKIYCESTTPFFHDWAWNAHIDELKRTWSGIPEGVDILVTHGPAYGILDQVNEYATTRLGCAVLRDEIQNRIKPKLHICGHIHGGYGNKKVNETHHFNVAICDESYYPSNEITLIDWSEYEHSSDCRK